jgi:lipopolysaccharide transport system ATP-binding protein
MTAAIRIDRLSKRYLVSHEQQRGRYQTLREALSRAAMAPLRRLSGKRPASVEEFWALRDVTAEICAGEVIGIIGRNGAGKSTLLKVLSRITKPTRGRVEIDGRVGSLLEVGTGFHNELTGRENIYLSGSILGMSKREIDRKFDQIVDFAEIEQFLDTPVKRYSSGMYVRLAFAVAANLEPEVLIVDEVLAVGDAEFQRKCLGKMEDVVEQGRTVCFVSHNMAAIRSLCSSAIFLDGGRIIAEGDVETCVAAYFGEGAQRHAAVVELPIARGKSAQITQIELLNQRGEPTCNLHYGDELTLRVHFRSDVPTQSPRVGLVIASAAGERLLNTNMHFLPHSPPARPCRRGVIHCSLGMVPLMAGEYFLSLWFGVHGGESDVLHDVLGFQVSESDPWGLGKLPHRNASLLWWPTQFQVESES